MSSIVLFTISGLGVYIIIQTERKKRILMRDLDYLEYRYLYAKDEIARQAIEDVVSDLEDIDSSYIQDKLTYKIERIRAYKAEWD